MKVEITEITSPTLSHRIKLSEYTRENETHNHRRNEIKIPLTMESRIDKIKLDYDSPKLKQAMRNLGF